MIVIRYSVFGKEKVVESFLGFIPIKQHNDKYLFEVLETFLKDNDIDMMNCHLQSYDNASNMSDIYSSVQTSFHTKNSLVEWIPCAAHSLDLVGSVAAECCTEAVIFFNVLQSVYTFLSISTQRWSFMLTNLKNNVYVVQNVWN